MVRSFVATFLLLFSFSAIAQTPEITFEASAVVAKVRPGATTAWVGPGSATRIVTDSDGDGVVRIETTTRQRAGWGVVDMATGAYALAAPAEVQLTQQVLADASILRGTSGAYSEFVVTNVGRSVRHHLIVRPGAGAWELLMADFIRPIRNDLDGVFNDITVFRASQFRAVAGAAPLALEGVEPGDVLIAMDTGGWYVTAKRIDAAYLATGDGKPGVLNTKTRGFANDTIGGGLTIVRVGGSTGTLSIDYQTADKTAKAGVDYIAVSGTLTFAPGQVIGKIDVPIPPDGVHTGESFEFEMRLSNPVGTTVDGPMTQAVTLVDGEREPLVSIESKRVPEGDGPQQTTVRVTLSNPSTKPSKVPWYLVGAPHEGTLVFAPGELSKTITVPWNGDTKRQPNRWMEVVLVIFRGENIRQLDDELQPIMEVSGWVTILDDDGPSKRRSAGR